MSAARELATGAARERVSPIRGEGLVDSTSQELVDAFERGTLPPQSFRHREHLNVAWYYLRKLPFEEAAMCFERHLVRYADAHGAASKIDLPLTWAYLGLVAEALRGQSFDGTDVVAHASFAELLERRPDLLTRRLLRAAPTASTE